MDPVTAVALAIAAGFEWATEVVKGQTPEVKARIWEQWFAMVDRALANDAAAQKFWLDLFKGKEP